MRTYFYKEDEDEDQFRMSSHCVTAHDLRINGLTPPSLSGVLACRACAARPVNSTTRLSVESAQVSTTKPQDVLQLRGPERRPPDPTLKSSSYHSQRCDVADLEKKQLSKWRLEWLNEINDTREGMGLQRLRLNGPLCTVAEQMRQNSAERESLSGVKPEKLELSQACQNVGYNYLRFAYARIEGYNNPRFAHSAIMDSSRGQTYVLDAEWRDIGMFICNRGTRRNSWTYIFGVTVKHANDEKLLKMCTREYCNGYADLKPKYSVKWTKELLNHLNVERADEEVPPLHLSRVLSKVARMGLDHNWQELQKNSVDLIGTNTLTNRCAILGYISTERVYEYRMEGFPNPSLSHRLAMQDKKGYSEFVENGSINDVGVYVFLSTNAKSCWRIAFGSRREVDT